MQIIIHRGTHQIGGCTAEIRTDSTRILIDFGAELPDAEGNVSIDTLKIDGLNCGKANFDGVFLTHYHRDHIGLISRIMEPIPIFLGGTAIDILTTFSERVQNSYKGISGRLRPLTALKPITVSDIRITPIPADHSAYDAYMFLIEAEGKRILHTGDFRLHGFRGKATPKLLSQYAQGIDVLIIEGTQISRDTRQTMSELELQKEISREIRSHKYVFVLCASTNIDRLASFYNATPRGKYFVCDKYQKCLLDVIAEKSGSKWYQFDKALIYGENLKLRERGFVMPVRVNHSFLKIISKYPEAVLIYSMWEGYLDGRSPELSQLVLPFEETGNIRYLHSSGHATSTDTQIICNAVMPKKGIIPIHTENGESFKELELKCPILHLKDGEIFSL